ncbi:MAG TPA: hypothetical protein VJ044_11200, partial [Candidatus Hodarchaeales archaeon]|nr:hypothetical protein [Candidatus Hodarchaeales archaeon]
MQSSGQREFTTEVMDSILGSPSSQRILRLLLCWNQLPIKEIVKKSDLSDSQVYNTLKSLQSIGLVISPSRGIYSIPKTQFVEKLGEAYLPQLVQLIGKEMYLLGKDLDKIPFVELDRRFSLLVDRWEPLIDTHFRAKASFLAEHILQRAG